MGRGATGWGRWGGGQRGGLDGERGNGKGEMERGATGRGRWGKWEGEMGRGQRRGRRGSWQRGGAEEGARGGGISHMKCFGEHMECLGGTRLQIFLTLFTRATPGTPASYHIKCSTFCNHGLNSFGLLTVNNGFMFYIV